MQYKECKVLKTNVEDLIWVSRLKTDQTLMKRDLNSISSLFNPKIRLNLIYLLLMIYITDKAFNQLLEGLSMNSHGLKIRPSGCLIASYLAYNNSIRLLLQALGVGKKHCEDSLDLKSILELKVIEKGGEKRRIIRIDLAKKIK